MKIVSEKERQAKNQYEFTMDKIMLQMTFGQGWNRYLENEKTSFIF